MPRPVASAFWHRHAAFAEGSDTPRDFLERCLEKLDFWEPDVQAFTVIDIAAARRQADAATKRWRNGGRLSLIDGMPVGIKDIIDTHDMPTEYGSALYEGHRPRFDAASVAGLRMAGAVLLGKTVTTEFAATSPGPTRNPWDLTRTPGGSSSGSAAAVAAGMVSAALGTQVVGSIIRPAGFCGVIGYKPSYGGINRGGSLDFLSQSCTGVLAATLEDAWLVAREVAARVGGDPGHASIAGPSACPEPVSPRRVAVLQTAGWKRLNDETAAALRAVIEDLRCAGVAVETKSSNVPLNDAEEALAVAFDETLEMNAWEWRWPLNVFMQGDRNRLSAATKERAAKAEAMKAQDYHAAIARRAAARRRFAVLAEEFDVLITASAPGPAPPGLHHTGDPIFAVPASYLGVPAVTIPVMPSSGLPAGLQIIGFHGEDAKLFANASAIRSTHISRI